MKKLIGSVFLICATFAFNSASAATTIVTETSSWRPVPIEVDSSTHVYTVTGTVPSDTTEFYYTYPGYRCFQTKREVGVDALIFKASVEGGTDIYCYPE